MTTLGRREKCPRNRSEKGAFPGVCVPTRCESGPPGAAGNTVEQNRLKPCKGRPFGLCGELE